MNEMQLNVLERHGLGEGNGEQRQRLFTAVQRRGVHLCCQPVDAGQGTRRRARPRQRRRRRRRRHPPVQTHPPLPVPPTFHFFFISSIYLTINQLNSLLTSIFFIFFFIKEKFLI